ncbi:uncharacterized protein [Eleutherodactylus coqui]|uniref:uncharacterized protein isoform X2 n=1 Tax=Eleutherodactylus coqui TaxID=57060 RepID=UPI00346271BF
MEKHKPLKSPSKSSKRNSSKSRKSEENHNASRSPPNHHIGKPKGGSSRRNTSENFPSPPYSQEDHSILQDNQGEHFSDFEIIVKEEVQEEKVVIPVTIEEEEVPKNTSPESQTAKIPRLRRMELKVKELISAVKSHPELWDPSDRGYSDRQKKTAAWSSVCCHLYPDWDCLDSRDKGILDNDVRRRWRSARDQFRREIVQREGQNGSAPPSKRPYIYLEELMFLMPVLDLRPANANGGEADVQTAQEHQLEESELDVPAATPAGGASDPNDGGRSMCSEEPPTTSTATLVSQRVLPLQFGGWKDKKTSSSSASEDTIDTQVLAYLQRNIEEDSEDAFVRSLGSYIRKVPERWRLWLRSSIQTLIEACIPPNDPEKVLGLLDQVKLARPSSIAPTMDIEFTDSLPACQSASQPHYSLSASSEATPNSYPQSPPCSSHSFSRLPSYNSHSSRRYTQDSSSQPSYAYGVSYNSSLSSSNIPLSSSRSFDHVPMSTPQSCLTACVSMSSSPSTRSSYSTSRPKSQ